MLAQPHLLAADTLISLDSASQFFPWYVFMGESLRAGHIPGWNPATFSGSPFAANPLSGWTYLPAMVLFSALPLALAWIVHAATQIVPDATAATALITTGSVDGRSVAVLEDTPPSLEIPSDPSLDRAQVTSYEADRLVVMTSTTAPGLVVLGEIYYPAWKAYVDGQPADICVADGALRAVPVPSGEHLVELRFESASLAVGIVLSCAAWVLLALLGVAVAMTDRH